MFYLFLLEHSVIPIRTDSVSLSLLRFPFLSHVQVLTCEISLLCRLKYPYSCFSSHFYFLVILLLNIVLLVLLLITIIIIVVVVVVAILLACLSLQR